MLRPTNLEEPTVLYQIEKKDYATAYKGDGRKVIKLALNFDEDQRNITDYKIAEC